MLFWRVLGSRQWVFSTGGITKTAVVLLCLHQQDFVRGIVIIFCFPLKRLGKKRSKINGIFLKGFFFLRAANALQVMVSQEEVFGHGRNWRVCIRFWFLKGYIKIFTRKLALVTSFLCSSGVFQ